MAIIMLLSPPLQIIFPKLPTRVTAERKATARMLPLITITMAYTTLMTGQLLLFYILRGFLYIYLRGIMDITQVIGALGNQLDTMITGDTTTTTTMIITIAEVHI